MITVTWVSADGSEKVTQVALGVNLMEAAQANDIDSVIGECGGSMACATCHVVVDPAAVSLQVSHSLWKTRCWIWLKVSVSRPAASVVSWLPLLSLMGFVC